MSSLAKQVMFNISFVFSDGTLSSSSGSSCDLVDKQVTQFVPFCSNPTFSIYFARVSKYVQLTTEDVVLKSEKCDESFLTVF